MYRDYHCSRRHSCFVSPIRDPTLADPKCPYRSCRKRRPSRGIAPAPGPCRQQQRKRAQPRRRPCRIGSRPPYMFGEGTIEYSCRPAGRFSHISSLTLFLEETTRKKRFRLTDTVGEQYYTPHVYGQWHMITKSNQPSGMARRREGKRRIMREMVWLLMGFDWDSALWPRDM